ncbi:hypothetical protein chiPu_0018399 [Chiloscyllium punctatum]|uniref:Fibronectin type-III domain-containing protein n=1 Tax=Chiloscyllium punctatum TaxID=137246 RepID=A0A401RMT4_CHIPU|nr:hypothetical protein [Chiloscyllium punctatum]
MVVGQGSLLAATPGFLPPDVSHPSQQEDGDQLTHLVAGSKSTFQQTGLASGQEYEVTVWAKKGKKLGPAVSRTLTTREYTSERDSLPSHRIGPRNGHFPKQRGPRHDIGRQIKQQQQLVSTTIHFP